MGATISIYAPWKERSMPNKRDPEKKQMSFWIKKSKIDKVEAIARELGMTKTEFAQYAIELALKLESEKELKNGKDNNK